MITLPQEIISIIYNTVDYASQCNLRISSTKFLFLPKPSFYKSTQWTSFHTHVRNQFQYTHQVMQQDESGQSCNADLLIQQFTNLPFFAQKRVRKEMKLVLQTISILMSFTMRQRFHALIHHSN